MDREYRLRAASDFQRARTAGRSWGHSLFNLHVVANSDETTRCGFVVSKRVGKAAVVRNRVRRRLREIVRALLPRMAPGYDLVLSARPPAATAAYGSLRDGVHAVFQRASLFIGTPA